MLVEVGSQHLVIQPSRDGRGGAGLEGAPACPRVCRGKPVIIVLFVHRVCSVQMFQIRKLDSYKDPMNVLRHWILPCFKIVTLIEICEPESIQVFPSCLRYLHLRPNDHQKGGGSGNGGAGVNLDGPLHGRLFRVGRRQPGVQLAPPPHGHLPHLPLWQRHPGVQGGQVEQGAKKCIS